MEETKNKYENSLFHYTNAEGLKGILESNKLWATATYCTNDKSEFKHYLNILNNIMAKDFNRDAKEYPDYAFNRLVKTDNHNKVLSDLFSKLNHFISSFKMIKNENEGENQNGLLSQWRGYGNDGGYAIKFDKEKLIEASKKIKNDFKEQANIIWNQVTYNDDDNFFWRKFYEDHIKQMLEPIDKDLRAGELVLTNIKPSVEAFEAVCSLAPFAKNNHFNEENEFRLSVSTVDSSECKFTNRNGLIIPYIELNFDIISCINRIIIGPNPRSDDRVRSVKALLEACIKKHKLDVNIKVTQSNIPFNRE